MILDGLHRQDGLVTESGELPSKFEFNIGGFMGASYEVELKDQEIEYTWYGSGRKRRGAERIVPDLDQWRAFREKLDELGFWSWHRHRSDSKLGGTSWSVLIRWGHRRVESEPSNECPEKFEGVLGAVRGLIGGRAFR